MPWMVEECSAAWESALSLALLRRLMMLVTLFWSFRFGICGAASLFDSKVQDRVRMGVGREKNAAKQSGRASVDPRHGGCRAMDPAMIFSSGLSSSSVVPLSRSQP